jgi:hypothetical protein
MPTDTLDNIAERCENYIAVVWALMSYEIIKR